MFSIPWPHVLDVYLSTLIWSCLRSKIKYFILVLSLMLYKGFLKLDFYYMEKGFAGHGEKFK